jgi:hypothetical protein
VDATELWKVKAPVNEEMEEVVWRREGAAGESVRRDRPFDDICGRRKEGELHSVEAMMSLTREALARRQQMKVILWGTWIFSVGTLRL